MKYLKTYESFTKEERDEEKKLKSTEKSDEVQNIEHDFELENEDDEN